MCCASAFLSRFLKSSLLRAASPECDSFSSFSLLFLFFFFFFCFLLQTHHLFTNHVASSAAQSHPTGCVGTDAAARKENVTLLSSLDVLCSQIPIPRREGQRLSQPWELPAAPCSPTLSPVVLTPPGESLLPSCCPQNAVYPCATTALDVVERCDGGTDGTD